MRAGHFLAARVAEFMVADCLICSVSLGPEHRAGVCLSCWATLPREGVCSALPGVDGLSAPFCYRDQTQALILAAKAAPSTGLLFALGDLLAAYLAEDPRLRSLDAIMCAPSHPWSDLRRGFSPAREISRPVSRRLGVPLLRGLKRGWLGNSSTKGLPRLERLQLDRKIFLRGRIPGPTILLIDDVVSTGQTLAQCAQTLRRAGAETIWAAAVARNR